MIRFSHIAWVVLIGVALVVFAYTGSPVALFGGFAAVVVPLLGLIPLHFALPKVEATLRSPATAAKGTKVVCELYITNKSRMPLARVEAYVEIHNMLTDQTETVRLRASVAPRGTVTVPCVLVSTLCGRVECRDNRLVLYEPFGLLKRSRTSTTSRRLSIMPTLYDAPMRTVLSIAPLSDTVTYSQITKGPDASETFGLREYEEGDDLRRIHWKLSDKIGKTIVREASLPLDNSLLVFWDKTLVSSGEAIDVPHSADAMAEVMLGVCEQLAHDGIEYDVAFNDVRQGRCFLSHVTCEEDIYEVIGHLISVPLAVSSEVGLATYMREFGSLVASRIVYVGMHAPDENDSIVQSRQFLAFVCDNTDAVDLGTQLSVIHFRSDDAEGALANAGMI